MSKVCQCGIDIGTTLATAHSIAPSIRHFNRDPGRERQRLKLLAETLYRFTSQVSIQAPDSLLLEISGSLNLFGCLHTLQQQTEALCASLAHQTRVHVATTPLAALAQARSGRQQLKEVPLAYCEIDPALLERFANMGIYTLGPLLDLPQADLGQRFGAAIINYLERLTGEAPDPREAIIPPERFSSTLHLLDPVTDKDALLFPMKRLLVELHHWLVSHQLGAEQLSWRFAPFDNASAVVMPVRSARARQSQQAFLDISRLRLEQIDVPEVMSVSLSSSRLVAWNNVSSGLFDQQPQFAAPASSAGAHSANNALADLIDHLNARLGSEACRSIQVADQHAPELAWQSVEPLSRSRSAVSSSVSTAVANPATPLPATRPTWLFEPPRKVNQQDLTLLWGPERIQTAWWGNMRGNKRDNEREQGLLRDYYVVRHRNGARCWAFTDMSQHWYLHGYFS